MPIYEFSQSGIVALMTTTFASASLHERRDLQRLLRENIEVISPHTLIISEEFGEWEESKRRIDLLGLDSDANLVVIELKRTEDGGHMELQAIRYASMVSTMTFDRAIEVFAQFLAKQGKGDQDPRSMILDFLEWEKPDEDQFAQDVRIVLASAEFSREITSSVIWLIDHGVDIRCVRLKPYSLDTRLLVDVQQIIPLPEAAEFQIQIREKVQKEREARTTNQDFTKYDIQIDGEQHPSMSKRNAIFLICKRLCERSIAPEDVASRFKRRSDRAWYYVDGNVNASEFAIRAAEKRATQGRKFDPGRYFCEDNELVHSNNKTYAFSSQWGGEIWLESMAALKEGFPEFKIDFKPVM